LKQETEKENLAHVRALFDGMLETKPLEWHEHFFEKTVRIHAFGTHAEQDVSVGWQFDNRLAKIFEREDLHLGEAFASNDKVVIYWSLKAKRRTDKKSISIDGTSMYRLVKGKIVEVWQNWDRLGLLEQLGEVRVCSALVSLQANYDTLQKFGMENTATAAENLSPRERQCLQDLVDGKKVNVMPPVSPTS
jgi:hypothetical protein